MRAPPVRARECRRTELTTVSLLWRLEAAKAIAVEAGALARVHFCRLDTLQVERKGRQDLVSAADREVERFIRDRLSALFPQDGLLGEELGHETGGAGTWVIDPIDGTWCFLNGIASWCISIAYVEHGEIVLGVIVDPNVAEVFAAVRGGGSTLNGRRIRVSDARSLSEGSLSVGFSPRSAGSEVVPIIAALLAQGGVYHRHGSGALALAWAACGRLIGYIEPHMMSWDALAGLILIEEAGGNTAPFLVGNALHEGSRVIAAPPQLFEAVTSLAPWAAAPAAVQA